MLHGGHFFYKISKNVVARKGVLFLPHYNISQPPYNIILKNVVGSRGDDEKNVVGGRGVQIFFSYRPSPNFKNGTALIVTSWAIQICRHDEKGGCFV